MLSTLIKRSLALNVLLALSFASCSAAANPSCADIFSATPLGRIAQTDKVEAKLDAYFAEINGVLVTGASEKVTLDNLSLSQEELQLMQSKRSQVLSVGEGTGELLPSLLKRGIRIKALDLWYHSPELENMRFSSDAAEEMADYQNIYGANLIRGSALNIPLADQSIDIVLSQRLANNLHISEQLQFVNESIRILRVGGEGHILLTLDRVSEANEKMSRYFETVLNYLGSTYGSRVRATMSGGLLVIEKIKSTSQMSQPEIPFDPSVQYEGLPVGAKWIRSEEDAYRLEMYERALKLAKEHPEDTDLQTDLKFFESRLNSKKSLYLSDRSRFVRTWVAVSYKLFGPKNRVRSPK